MHQVFGGFCIAIAVAGTALWLTFDVLGANFFWVLPVGGLVGALLMPTNRFLTGFMLFFLLSIGILYGQHLYVSAQSPSHGGVGDAIGIFFVLLVALGVGVGAVLNIAVRFGLRHLPPNSSFKRTREKPHAA